MADNCTIVIFGASGDLTQRKLAPALYNLYRKDRLPDGIHIVGTSRTPYSSEEFRDRLREGVIQFDREMFDSAAWDAFAPRIAYWPGSLKEPADFERLEIFLRKHEDGAANRLYYLAVAPDLYTPAIENLHAARMTVEVEGEGWRRIVIEKPRRDSGRRRRSTGRCTRFSTSTKLPYRSHLGKDGAEHPFLPPTRFRASVEPPLRRSRRSRWRRRGRGPPRRLLRHVERAARHLPEPPAATALLVAMEPSASFNADAIRNEKVKVLSAIRPIALGDTARGSTPATPTAWSRAGSQTATFAAVKLYVETALAGVPFYLRSARPGDCCTEIVVQFQRPHVMLDLPDGTCRRPISCRRIHRTRILTPARDAVPDWRRRRARDMAFNYRTSFTDKKLPDAYERLLLDALNGDAVVHAPRRDERAWC
jgi:glucose-6-phosphate 1-dehydrogenase